jgi:SAM-dependent methyltransferase
MKGVHFASVHDPLFSDTYIKIREIENRVYSDQQLKQLPVIDKKHPHYPEWIMRRKSARRFSDYLGNKKPGKLLEIGCGNGWFTNLCSAYVNTAVGIDVNIKELEQAALVFKGPHIYFAWWDVFSENPFTENFDIIVLNAVVQYFPDLERLFNKLNQHLNPGGEIHIIDSPFYEESAISAAKLRSAIYYQKMGVPEMADHYFHHVNTKISDFEVMYLPSLNKLIRLIKGKDMPFGWYRRIKVGS